MVYPSYYENEGFPLILIEALAYGLPVVASRWRGIPELLGKNYPFLELPNNPDALAIKLHILLEETNYSKLRRRFEEHFYRSCIQKTESWIFYNLLPVTNDSNGK